MIKDLVVHLATGAKPDPASPFAISIAQAVGAHVSAVAFSYDPVTPPTIMGTIPASLIESQRAENDAAADKARAAFDAAAQRAGVSSDSRVLAASLPGSADRFAAIARRFDLAVVGQGEPGVLADAQELVAEGAVFSSGRPVVMVPYIQKDGLKLDRVMVCWDASRAAARAVGDALPLLAKAKTIEVVIVASDRPKSDEIPGADIGQHLARHGLKVDVKRIVATDTDVANTILSHAADSSADFIVMGGYGHSRLREFILGGATRGIMSSMTVPVLMSH
jgi:nucleotide-binding universal stress UspA family protein